MNVKMLNEFVLVGNPISVTDKKEFIVPSNTRNKGFVLQTCEANKHLLGHSVYYGKECETIEIENKTYFVMKSDNIYLIAD